MSKQSSSSQDVLQSILSGGGKGKRKKEGKKGRKFGRNLVVCARYRARVGKPLGPGVPGNKCGKKKVVRNFKA